MSVSTAHEIGIVHYPGAQVACILGLVLQDTPASSARLTVFQVSAGVASVMPKSIIYRPFGIFALVEGGGGDKPESGQEYG